MRTYSKKMKMLFLCLLKILFLVDNICPMITMRTYSIEFLSPWHRLLTEGTADNFGLALRQVFFNQTYPATSKPSLPQSLLSSWSPSPSPWNQRITVIHVMMLMISSQACPIFAREFDKALAAGVNILFLIIIIISVVQVIIIVLIFSFLSI